MPIALTHSAVRTARPNVALSEFQWCQHGSRCDEPGKTWGTSVYSLVMCGSNGCTMCRVLIGSHVCRCSLIASESPMDLVMHGSTIQSIGSKAPELATISYVRPSLPYARPCKNRVANKLVEFEIRLCYDTNGSVTMSIPSE